MEIFSVSSRPHWLANRFYFLYFYFYVDAFHHSPMIGFISYYSLLCYGVDCIDCVLFVWFLYIFI
jgi:hypothetical protein